MMGWLLFYLVAGIIFAVMGAVQVHRPTWAQSNWAQRLGVVTTLVAFWPLVIFVIIWDDIFA